MISVPRREFEALLQELRALYEKRGAATHGDLAKVFQRATDMRRVMQEAAA